MRRYEQVGTDALDAKEGDDVLCETSIPAGWTCPGAQDLVGGDGDDEASVAIFGCSATSLVFTGGLDVEMPRDTNINWSQVANGPVLPAAPYPRECIDMVNWGGW